MVFSSDRQQILQRADSPIAAAPLRFFDIETSGLRPDRGARITEVAVLDREGVVMAWRRKAGPAGESFTKHLPVLFSHLSAGVVVGHNLRFDLHFISYVAGRHGFEGPAVRFLDTLDLAHQLLDRKSNFQLSELLAYFDIVPADELHTALGDARATRELFWKLVDHGELHTLADAGLKQLDWRTL